MKSHIRFASTYPYKYPLDIWAQKLQLRDGIAKQVHQSSNSGEVDILNWMSRTALELVGQGGLGYSFDPLIENTRNSFGEALKAVL